MIRSAVLDPSRTYRYSLTREWGEREWGERESGTLLVIGLNPSTADEEVDDPTIRRCIGFAKREGRSRLVMVNLFAFRATDPRELLAIEDPIGPLNDQTIRIQAAENVTVVAAWGATTFGKRAEHVLSLIKRGVWCLGKTMGGHPRHPLYLRADTPLTLFRHAKP